MPRHDLCAEGPNSWLSRPAKHPYNGHRPTWFCPGFQAWCLLKIQPQKSKFGKESALLIAVKGTS